MNNTDNYMNFIANAKFPAGNREMKIYIFYFKIR